ncbi:MAG: sugar phosphate nucleotidyltransferase [Eubacteriales bacterium]
MKNQKSDYKGNDDLTLFSGTTSDAPAYSGTSDGHPAAADALHTGTGMDRILPIIMAGGEGTRLRPITETIPKPLVPVDGKPAVLRILDTLAGAGWKRAVLTVCYRKDDIRALLGAEYHGIHLDYAEESPDRPLGTAGSVRAAWDTFSRAGDTDALILSGDAVFSADLGAFVSTHRDKRADASILCVRVPDPSAYGVVLTDSDGRITGFSEKPSVAEAISDTVNTGIYLLTARFIEGIPPHTALDFGQDVFGAALGDGVCMQMYLSDGYWCDIGSFDAYLDCCLDMASGRIAGFAPSRTMLPPHISDSAVGRNCFLPATASVRQSVLFDRVSLGAGASVTGSILCAGVTVGDLSVIEAGCVIGEGTVIGDRVHLVRGTKISAGASVSSEGSKTDTKTEKQPVPPYMNHARASAFNGGMSISPFLTDIGYALSRPGSSVPEVEICAAAARALVAAAAKTESVLFAVQDCDMPACTAALRIMRETVACSPQTDAEVVFCHSPLPAQAARMPQLQLPIKNTRGTMLRAVITMYGGRPTAALYGGLGLYPDRTTERMLDMLFADALSRVQRYGTEADGLSASSGSAPVCVVPPAEIDAEVICDAYIRRYTVPFMRTADGTDRSQTFAFRCGTGRSDRLLSRLLCAGGGTESPSAALLFRIEEPHTHNGTEPSSGAAAADTGMLTVYEKTEHAVHSYSHWEILALLAQKTLPVQNTMPAHADTHVCGIPFPTPREPLDGEAYGLSLPFEAPSSIASAMRYSHCPSLPAHNPVCASARARRMAALEAEDGILLAQRLALLLVGTGEPLHALFTGVRAAAGSGAFSRRCAAAPAGAMSGSAATATLRRMTEGSEANAFVPAVEGIVFYEKDGSSVRVVATRQKNFRIIADAYSAEAAEELCRFAKERLLSAAVSADIPYR